MYHLSNRQAKELLVRSSQIMVALPAPAETPANLITWAKSMLSDNIAQYVTHAEERELACAIQKKVRHATT
jgi:hypothetical protein